MQSPNEGRLSLSSVGSYEIKAGFNEIPVHMELSSLSLQFASTGHLNAVLSHFEVIGRQSSVSVNAPNDLFSAVYPASNALFTAWLIPSPYEPVNAITLQGVPKCKARAYYNASSDIKKQSAPTMRYAQIEDFPLPKSVSSCSLSYTGSCSLNGVALPSSLQGEAVYEFPQNEVQIGSQTVAADVPWNGDVSLQCDGVSAFSLTLDGDDVPYILYSPSNGGFLAGYSPSDFAPLTFLPVTQWQDVYGQLALPSAFYGGVFKIDFTDLPSGITASQEELAFQIFDMEEKPVRQISSTPKPAKPEIGGLGSPMVLTSAPVKKPSEAAPTYSSHTPFFSNSGAGIVYPGGNAFTGATIAHFDASFISLGADISSSLSSAYQGFTGELALSRMGYSIAAENVQGESDDYPIEGNTVYIDPSFLNGKTVEFAYPFKSIQLAPGQSELAGYLSTFPIPLDTHPTPENIYAATPDLDVFWSDPNAEWSAADKSWGMDNPNLKYSHTPDLVQPYMTLSSAKQATVTLGVHNSGRRPVGCQVQYQIAPNAGNSASLVFSQQAPVPLIADGQIHTCDIAPTLPLQSTAELGIDLIGEIRIYEAMFTEGNWSLYATTGAGYRISLNPLLRGAIVNLAYWTQSLTFDLVNYGSSPSLPGGFTLQANLDPEITLAEEAEYSPYSYIFFSNTSPDAAGFFQVQAQGIDMDTGSLIPLSPDLVRFELSSAALEDFSYFGGGWFYCASPEATATVTAWYGGQSYPISLT